MAALLACINKRVKNLDEKRIETGMNEYCQDTGDNKTAGKLCRLLGRLKLTGVRHVNSLLLYTSPVKRILKYTNCFNYSSLVNSESSLLKSLVLCPACY